MLGQKQFYHNTVRISSVDKQMHVFSSVGLLETVSLIHLDQRVTEVGRLSFSFRLYTMRKYVNEGS